MPEEDEAFANDRLAAQRIPKAPLCKGGCQANSLTGGLSQPLRQKSKIFDTSPYTGEALGCR